VVSFEGNAEVLSLQRFRAAPPLQRAQKNLASWQSLEFFAPSSPSSAAEYQISGEGAPRARDAHGQRLLAALLQINSGLQYWSTLKN
jgi:hypothetical protein